jgi:hypothetical protein
MEELAQIKQKDIDKESKLRIVGKHEQKEARRRSPDVGDMRMWLELMKDATSGTRQQTTAGMNRRPFPRKLSKGEFRAASCSTGAQP